MQEYSIEEARARFEELMDLVAQGGSFLLRRGEDLARVEPFEQAVGADQLP